MDTNRENVIRLIECLGFIKSRYSMITSPVSKKSFLSTFAGDSWVLKYDDVEYEIKIFNTGINLTNYETGKLVFSIVNLIDDDYNVFYKELRKHFKVLFRKKIIEEI